MILSQMMFAECDQTLWGALRAHQHAAHAHGADFKEADLIPLPDQRPD